MTGSKYIKLLGLIAGVAVLNIVVFSPGFVGLSIGGGALAAASGVTLLLASAVALLYGSYVLLARQPEALPVKQVTTHEDYVEALTRYERVKPIGSDIRFALEQMERIRKKKETLMDVLNQRFEPGELSYKKFASVIREVEKLFYLNLRSLLNRLHVFDEADFASVMTQKTARYSKQLLQEKTTMYNDFLSFLKYSLDNNEEILLKLDKLLLEISRLDSFEPGDIENMPCMQEIDSLIKQTKYYKQ
ncbi:hypothetical protein D7M11_03950 [Paenibacillus ginsengarvi]|uniref:5-bromo-4-chloroindolyl phosphate hydrolysis protein n=1 Tax=Paenibacillus ginsengarvi TaxID=400777 RepID=A0A3B0CLV4_9BACL|nr:hypothetical protein [Paenibacillus ginsengarvi]RKN86172.1 hypothetical protein D7M11_03950 [Paenibacillus ginsengarvi]